MLYNYKKGRRFLGVSNDKYTFKKKDDGIIFALCLALLCVNWLTRDLLRVFYVRPVALPLCLFTSKSLPISKLFQPRFNIDQTEHFFDETLYYVYTSTYILSYICTCISRCRPKDSSERPAKC